MSPKLVMGDCAPASTIERLQRAVAAHGPRRVVEATGLSEAAFWRCYAGVRVRHGTVHQVHAGLDLLELEAGAA